LLVLCTAFILLFISLNVAMLFLYIKQDYA
jgi:hypothetical protein